MKRERSVPLTLDDRLFAQTKSTSLETPMDGTCGAQRVLSRPGLGFFGDYEILGKLGHGGMGVRWVAVMHKDSGHGHAVFITGHRAAGPRGGDVQWQTQWQRQWQRQS